MCECWGCVGWLVSLYLDDCQGTKASSVSAQTKASMGTGRFKSPLKNKDIFSERIDHHNLKVNHNSVSLYLIC